MSPLSMLKTDRVALFAEVFVLFHPKEMEILRVT